MCRSNTNGTAALYDISQLLNTGLDRETLATCVSMIESGVNPEALAVSWKLLYSIEVVKFTDHSWSGVDCSQGTQEGSGWTWGEVPDRAISVIVLHACTLGV